MERSTYSWRQDCLPHTGEDLLQSPQSGPPAPTSAGAPHLLACPACCCAPDDRPLDRWTLPWAPRSCGRSSAPHTTGLASPGPFARPRHSLVWGWGREVPQRQRSSHMWTDSHDGGCLINRGLGHENTVCRRKSLGRLLGPGLLVCNPLLTVVKSLDVGILALQLGHVLSVFG